MSDRPKKRRGFPAASFGVRPGDFPVGSVQSRAAARALVSALEDERNTNALADLGELSDVEQAFIEGEEPLTGAFIVRLYRIAQERAEVYRMPLPYLSPAQIRQTRAVNREVERMTGESLISTDSGRWKKLKALAEENLRAKKG